MSTFICEKEGCTEIGRFHCTKCKELGLSRAFGNYCGAVCQKSCFASHKILHQCMTRYPQMGVGWTIALALHELFFINRLPTLAEDGYLSLYLFGCRTGFESLDASSDRTEYMKLYVILKATIFPTILGLHVVLNGFELMKLSPVKTNNLTLRYVEGDAAKLAPSLDFSHAVAVIMGPGFSINIDMWNSFIRHLVRVNVPTITTGYSHEGGRLTYDAVHDERILATYFLANILIHSTPNPAVFSGRPGRASKNAYYLVFQGLNGDATAVSRDELHRINQIEFLKDLSYQATTFENNPGLARRCDAAVELAEQGRAPFPANATLKEIDMYVMYG